jgi:aminoglycoside phosphotransferase (APT) family kinase protein
VLEPDLAQIALVLDRSLSDAWEPVASDVPERAVVCEAAEWLRPRTARLAEAPQQLVHGDWSTPNLLFDVNGTATVGVLDWQLNSVGPVISDIAQAVAGVLMWSELDAKPVVDAIFDAYGDGADRRLLGAALLSYRLRNYWLLRDELALDYRHQEAVDRQGDRLRTVMDYVEHLDNA